jgi:hypothetical protein
MLWTYRQITAKAEELMSWIGWDTAADTTVQSNMIYTPIFKTTSFAKYK